MDEQQPQKETPRYAPMHAKLILLIVIIIAIVGGYIVLNR